MTFATTDDARQQTDTPADMPSAHVNIVNLGFANQTAGLSVLALAQRYQRPQSSLSPDSAASLMPVPGWPAWTRQGLRLGFSKLQGRVLLFDPKTNFVPDQPIADSHGRRRPILPKP